MFRFLRKSNVQGDSRPPTPPCKSFPLQNGGLFTVCGLPDNSPFRAGRKTKAEEEEETIRFYFDDSLEIRKVPAVMSMAMASMAPALRSAKAMV